jgi:hypothetical protein
MSRRHRRLREEDLSSGWLPSLNGTTLDGARLAAGFRAAARRDAAGPRMEDMPTVVLWPERTADLTELAKAGAFMLGEFWSEPRTVNESVGVPKVTKVNGYPGGRSPSGGIYAAVWSGTVRRFGQTFVRLIFVAAILFAAAGWIGAPTEYSGAYGAPQRWVWFAAVLAGLVVSLIGALALAGLLAAAPSRRWALAAVLAMVPGAVAMAAAAGVLAWVGPSGVAAPFHLPAPFGPEGGFEGSASSVAATVLGWVGLGGVVLLAGGWVALGLAVHSSRELNQSDGQLLILAALFGAAGAYPPLRFLLVIGAVLLLSAGLGLASSAARPPSAGRAWPYRPHWPV